MVEHIDKSVSLNELPEKMWDVCDDIVRAEQKAVELCSKIDYDVDEREVGFWPHKNGAVLTFEGAEEEEYVYTEETVDPKKFNDKVK